jgi:UDP-GlcNAc:undecaprenyl-phosphate GlcNAc-1-phosphate transferase
MIALLILGISSLLLSLMLTPLCRTVSLRLSLVDIPDASRKLHPHPIPRLGGVAIVLSYLGAFGIVLTLASGGLFPFPENTQLFWQLLPPAGLIFAIGLVDDIRGLRPWQKFLGQTGAAALAFYMGIRVTVVGGFATEDIWSLPLTMLWLVGCTNAFNLIDGLDGLAAGVGLMATATTLLAALLQGNFELAVATLPLAGCLLGFLLYNFVPASIFLGDCGSLLIGFLLGCYGVTWGQKSATLLGMIAPMMALALPLLDVGLSIFRRFLSNRPIFGADRGHIHHRLLDRGMKPRTVVAILYAGCAVAALLSLMQSVLYHNIGGIVIVLFCGVVAIGVRKLGYVEFGVAREVLMRGGLRRILREEICLRNFRDGVLRATTFDEFWAAIQTAAQDLGFPYVRLSTGDRDYRCQVESGTPDLHWRFHVDLTPSVWIDIDRDPNQEDSTAIFQFVRVLQTALSMRAWAPASEPGKEGPSKAIRRFTVVPPRSAAAR